MILLPSVHVGPIQATMLVSVPGDILDKVSLVIVPVSTKRPFNNYVDKMRGVGDGVKKCLFLSMLRV